MQAKSTVKFIIVSILVFGCSKVNPIPTVEEQFDIPEGVKEPLAFEFMIHDVEGIVFNLLHSLHERDQGVVSTHEDYNVFAGRGECANQQLDTNLNILLLNYGNGCTDDSQKIRRGQIELNYSDPDDKIGNVVTVVLRNYHLNGLGLHGQIRIENISQTNSTDAKRYSLSFSNLELTINSESSIFTGNREVNYAKKNGSQFETTELDYFASNNYRFEISGQKAFNLSTPSTLLNTFNCWLNETYFPKSGAFSIQEVAQKETTSIDFGSGACDYGLLITDIDNNQKSFDLSAIL
jgi:hypothetical protein